MHDFHLNHLRILNLATTVKAIAESFYMIAWFMIAAFVAECHKIVEYS